MRVTVCARAATGLLLLLLLQTVAEAKPPVRFLVYSIWHSGTHYVKQVRHGRAHNTHRRTPTGS